MLALKRIQKELKDLNQETEDHANQIFSVSPNEGDMFKWSGYIFGPVGSPYQNGIFKIEIEFPNNYPFKPPKVYFNTKIYHPNISSSGVICLDILRGKWSPVLSITKLLLSISSLLTDPNPNDPLAPDVAYIYRTNKALFEKTAQYWTSEYAQI